MSKDSTSIELLEERAEVRREEVERGGVRVTIRVEELTQALETSLTEETITVESEPADEVVDVAPEPIDDGTTLVIPVIEEFVVLQKKFRIRERLRITRLKQVRTVQIPTTLKREIADVERYQAPPEAT